MTDFIEAVAIMVAGAVGIVAIMFVLGALYAFPVMWMWNYLMPDIFGLTEIGFWQAFWGTFMCGILFKNTAVQTSK